MQSASFLLVLYLISIFGYSLSRGFYSYHSFLVLAFTYMLFGFSFFLKKRTFIDNIGFELIAPFVFIINSLLFVLLFGGIYQEPGPALNLIKLAKQKDKKQTINYKYKRSD